MAQRDWMEKDFYKILGVPESASKDEIKRAYRKLAQKFHPDANKGDAEAEARFKEISEAHSVLANDEKRSEYDQFRRLVRSGGEQFFGFRPGQGQGSVRINIGDLFGDAEGDMGGLFGDLFGFRARAAGGRDVETETSLTFEEAVAGTTLTLASGARVRIPPGVKDGARIKVPGKGEPAPAGHGRPGDLYVRVAVAPHPIFSLAGEGRLHVTVPVTFTEAALGANVIVPTLDGSVTVKVPAGTPNGKVLRVKGKGAPQGRGGRGDLLVKIEVQVPRKLNRREKQILEEFSKVHSGSPREHLQRFIAGNGRKAS